MERRKCVVLLFCLMLFYSLFQTTVKAQSSSLITILSQGSISYYDPNVNLAVIPDDWHLTYGGGPQIIFLDYSVTRSGSPSIRLERHVDGVDVNTGRECDGRWYNVNPGDHIVAKCWMKTEPSALGDTNPFSGARIGVDLYNQESDHNYLLYGIESSSYPNTGASERENYVNWGTTTWVQRIIDFVVPSDYFTYDHLTTQTIPSTQVSSIVVWMQVWSSSYGATDPARAWFADAELYINPS